MFDHNTSKYTPFGGNFLPAHLSDNCYLENTCRKTARVVFMPKLVTEILWSWVEGIYARRWIGGEMDSERGIIQMKRERRDEICCQGFGMLGGLGLSRHP